MSFTAFCVKKLLDWKNSPYRKQANTDLYKLYNTNLHEKNGEENKIAIPEGVDLELLMKVLGNPEMAALLTSLAKTMKV
mgnify:FL=1